MSLPAPLDCLGIIVRPNRDAAGARILRWKSDTQTDFAISGISPCIYRRKVTCDLLSVPRPRHAKAPYFSTRGLVQNRGVVE
jgi:hypothetical protein